MDFCTSELKDRAEFLYSPQTNKVAIPQSGFTVPGIGKIRLSLLSGQDCALILLIIRGEYFSTPRDENHHSFPLGEVQAALPSDSQVVCIASILLYILLSRSE